MARSERDGRGCGWSCGSRGRANAVSVYEQAAGYGSRDADGLTMRTLFWFYLVVIFSGLAIAIVLGAVGR